MKTGWHWCEDKHKGQWNRIKSPGEDPNTEGQLIFSKEFKGERILFPTNGAEAIKYPCVKIK